MNAFPQSLGFVPAAAWMVGIFLLSSRPKVPDAPVLSDHLAAVAAHFAVYGILALLLVFGVAIAGRPLSRIVLLGIVAVATAYGVTDEIHQAFVPGRHATAFDVVIDSLGAMTAVCVLWVLRRRTVMRAEL